MTQSLTTNNARPKPYKRVLAVKMRALGDTVISTAALGVLADYAEHVDVLVPAAAAPLLQQLPFIDNIIAAAPPRSGFSKYVFWFRVVLELRRTGYAGAVVFHASLLTAVVARLALWGRGPVVVNHHKLNGGVFHKWMYGNFLSTRIVADMGVLKPNLKRDLDAVLSLPHVTAPQKAVQELQPHLHVTDAERGAAVELLKGQGWHSGEPLLFLGIGASKSTKRWPQKHFAELVRLVKQQDPRWRFVMCLIDADSEWVKSLQTESEDRIMAFTNLNLRQVMGLIALSQSYVGNDSGMKHVAVALGRPTVTVFGPESPEEWHPYSPVLHPHLYQKDLQCRTAAGTHWCALSECVVEKNRCLTEIQPVDVFNALTFALTQFRRVVKD